MPQKHNSYHSCMIISIILLTLNHLIYLSSADLVDEHYAGCAPLNSACNFPQNITYPFWDGSLAEYCGHPGFKVLCESNNITIKIKDETYNILSINYTSNSFIVTKQQFSQGPCPATKAELTNTTSLDLSLFNFTSNSENLALFYNCTSELLDSGLSFIFRCLDNSNNVYNPPVYNGADNYFAIDEKWEDKLKGLCEIMIYLPVLREQKIDLIKNLIDVSVGDVVLKGFELKWVIDDTQCDDCVNSKGRCGYNTTLKQPVCFCSNAVHSRTCFDSTAPNSTAPNSPGASTQQPLDSSPSSPKHHSSLSWRSGRWIVIAVVPVVVSITVVLFRIWLRRKYGTRIKQQAKIMLTGDKTNIQIGDLPMFELEKLVTATNDFHESNKLGRGGFGTVYKGKLEDGEEVAVKRLSKLSGQGLEEFMTEVLVISKLQHRNLVRLLGCCVEGEEKLLVYEYMPNKSLDALLFDRLYQELLGWKTRFNIIQGISRGLLYLHRDSRLKIIHRDLKASNILLDDKLNPKISDFGMAKIFGGSEDQADTNRVVGTYGYMSPEYAMEGRFSEKSDIYSFGVLLLEIVSGRRNNSFRNEESLSLLAHAWKLWNEDDILSLIDPVVLESGFQDEILRCIQVALLCVQELPEDRPNISMVISMIDSEVSNLPRPTQPGFTQRRYTQNQSENVTSSVNRVSLSYITGR